MTATKKTTKAKKSTRADAQPWDKENPKAKGEHKTLTPKAKASAKRHAKEAGRPYPNLVDNMRAARESKK